MPLVASTALGAPGMGVPEGRMPPKSPMPLERESPSDRIARL
eukprot:SAG31_NODE_40598_length_280_cov_0.569061_1_plen_41_part_10